jgi:hypothetical protein
LYELFSSATRGVQGLIDRKQRDDYIEELEKAVEQFAYYERRYMAKGAMIAYLQLSRDLKDLEGGEPGGMAIVRAISALNLSRMVFDYRSGSYNLYAVRIVSRLFTALTVQLIETLYCPELRTATYSQSPRELT